MAKTFAFPSSFMALNLIVFLTISSSLTSIEARPLRVAKPEKIEAFISGILKVKTEGPSPPGEGHRLTMARTLGRIKDSGPSPGEGNSYTNGALSKTIGGIKHSSLSPLSASQILVSEIKHSSSSPNGLGPRGEGHKFTMVHVLGGIKDSGPSPGDGNGYTNGAFSKTIGGTKYSSSSHGSSPRMLLAQIEESGPSHNGPGN